MELQNEKSILFIHKVTYKIQLITVSNLLYLFSFNNKPLILNVISANIIC